MPEEQVIKLIDDEYACTSYEQLSEVLCDLMRSERFCYFNRAFNIGGAFKSPAIYTLGILLWSARLNSLFTHEGGIWRGVRLYLRHERSYPQEGVLEACPKYASIPWLEGYPGSFVVCLEREHQWARHVNPKLMKKHLNQGRKLKRAKEREARRAEKAARISVRNSSHTHTGQ